MKPTIISLIFALILTLTPVFALSESDQQCPITIPSDRLLGQPFPESDLWHGSEALAIQLPYYGVWPTTKDGHLIAVKLFWWTAAFEAGKPSDLKVTVKPLNGEKNDVVISRTTTAHAADLGGWTYLTGVDFPSAGCWEFTADYLGQELRFVVETVDGARYRQIAEQHKLANKSE